MKKLFYLSILFLGLFSCQKELDQTIIPESQDNKIGVQLRETPCGGDLFCTKVSNSPSARISGGGVGVVVNGQEYEFLPMELYDQSTGIVLKYNDQILVLHNGSNEYLSTKNSGIVLPRELGMLMNVSFDNFGDRNGIASKIQTETGRPIQTTKGYPIIDITGVGGNPDDGGPTVINVQECDYIFVSSVEEFKDEFFKEGGSVADKTLVEDAFNNCPGRDDDVDSDGCSFCKDPRCLVDYLLEVDPNQLSDNSKELIIANYLRATFGLNDKQFLALSHLQADRDFAKILYAFSTSCENFKILDESFTPCEGAVTETSETIKDCIKDALIFKIATNLDISNVNSIVDGKTGLPISKDLLFDLLLYSSSKDEFENKLTEKINWLKLEGFDENDDCSKEMSCIYQKLEMYSLALGTNQIFDELNQKGNFGMNIIYDVDGQIEHKSGKIRHQDGTIGNKIDLGYIYENPNNKKEIPYTWSEKDSDMADTWLTGFNTNGNFVAHVAFNKFLCRDRNSLEIASVIMHEILHTRLLALVYDEMLDAGFDPSNILDFSIDEPYWDLAMTKLMIADPSNTTQHQVLYNLLMPEMIDNLMAMNNDTNPENREKYEYLVLSLLAKDMSPGGNIDDLIETGMVTWDRNGDGNCDPIEEDLNSDGVCNDEDSYLQLDRLKSLSEELSNPKSNLELECEQ